MFTTAFFIGTAVGSLIVALGLRDRAAFGCTAVFTFMAFVAWALA
jgi:hypothetical protein